MNPLLEPFNTPFETAPFDRIKNEHFLPAVQEAIAQAKQEIASITATGNTPDFTNTIEALERSGKLVNTISSIFFNLNAAETNEEIQRIAREISPLLTAYSNDILLDEALFKRVQAVYQQKASLKLSKEESMLLDKTYKSFVRNGANLDETGKTRLREIDTQLSQLSLEFGEHLLHETNAFQMEVTAKDDLKGLPESVVEAAAQTAKEKDKEGSWVFTLHLPSYLPFMTYAENRSLREKLFYAYGSRCFQGNEYDNQQVILTIVHLREERAKLLGYASHADYILEERMAESPAKVISFLNDLLFHAKPVALLDVEEVTDYAQQQANLPSLQRWDFAFFSEKLKKEKYSIDDEMLKPYFQLENVVQGVFEVANRLYGIQFKENKSIPTYHPDVVTYEVQDEDGKHLAVFYADFFPREGKRNGAWMTSYRGQNKQAGIDKRPHISIVCNFTKPTLTKPSLLTFNEVTTLFHEFGHALHGILANGTYESLTGTNVYWDFVELPSQVMENWVYEKECLDLFAKHYQTGEKIPAELIQRIRDSANFLSGYATVRQVGLAQLDMAWHSTTATSIPSVDTFEKQILQPTQVLPVAENTNTSCSFSHIFQGGYSAGYYSYKWAEVLDADAFEFFQEKGIFNRETARLFRTHVLSAGGSEPPMELYKRFRGKEPSAKALLKRAGLLKATSEK
ncbi:M3 family metallopeptidase [Rhodocytophaga aerolata]|uniref:M3 family metallopeptidase n=1 Tax=Rhodocytophaga aerolata TaxID=455078 RepID=A0ABT8R9K2_9BACT|nr:M3 family metallopeptidase [Rhodocytophaga aerolata]MDO1448771.1 M3 family metallopeptidase [Rhodocytophaga aerolata]